MSRKSHIEKNKSFEARRQIKWECVRLNAGYRKEYDAYALKFENGKNPPTPKMEDTEFVEKWGLPLPLSYKIKRYEKAVVFSSRDIPTNFMKTFMNNINASTHDFSGFFFGRSAIVKELPQCLKHFRVIKDLEIPGKEKISPSEFSSSVVKLSFGLLSEFEDVVWVLRGIYEKINRAKKQLGLQDVKPKPSLLTDALDIYEKVTYGKQTLRALARKAKKKAEDEWGAYNRIKKQFKTAKRYVEEGEHLLL